MSNATNKEWLEAMGGSPLSEPYSSDLFSYWIKKPIDKWTALHDARMLQSNASHLGHFGCLATVRVVHIHNVDSMHNVVKLHYIASGPSREKLAVLKAVKQQFIPSDWIAESGGYGMDAWWKLAKMVSIKSRVLLIKDNATNRQQAIEAKGNNWLRTLTENATQENVQFFAQFQYGPVLLGVSMDGAMLFEEPELAYVLAESQRKDQAAETIVGIDDRDWPGQREVARRFGVNPGDIARLLKNGDLKDNGKTLSYRKVDPVSILKYCEANGVAYNVDSDHS